MDNLIFLVLVILKDIKWYLIVVLICISLVTNDIEYLSYNYCTYYFAKFLFMSTSDFKFFLFICMNSLYIPDTSPLSDIYIETILFQHISCLFIFFRRCFEKLKFITSEYELQKLKFILLMFFYYSYCFLWTV